MKKIFFTVIATLFSLSSFAGDGWIGFNDLPIGGVTYKLNLDTIGQVSQGEFVTFVGSYSSNLECKVSIEFFRTNESGDLSPYYAGGHICNPVQSEILPITGEANGTFSIDYKFADDVQVTSSADIDKNVAFCLHCKLIPTDDSGEFGYSNNSPGHTFIIVENVATGIKTTEFKDLAVYPNPTRGLMNVAATFTNAYARVYDVSGRMLNEISIENNQVDVSSLKSGNYIMQIEGYSPISFIKN